MPSIKNENKRVEKFQMTGVVLGKKKIQKPVIVFDDTWLTLSTNTNSHNNKHWWSKFPFKRFLYMSLKLFSDIQCVCVAISQGPSFFEEPHFKYYIHHFEASILDIPWTEHVGQSILFARTERKVWREKLQIFSRWASTPCSCYLFMSPVHCMVYCRYKDDNFTDCIIRHIATKSGLWWKLKAISLYIVQYM